MNELWRRDAVDLVRAIRTKEVSCREVAVACLDRIQSTNPSINAIVDCRPEEVLKDAESADQAVRRGDDIGPLHGVPVTTKVNVDQRGYATTNGVPALQKTIAADDSPVVSNLRNAGAILLGRTNTPALSFRWFTDNDLHGETLNPVNPDITPGGSSGGAAAAVATGLGAIGHGNDYGGSIRYPAYACGVAGLRPSFGRVPAFNGTAGQERPITAQLMSVQGPLARTVRDLELALSVMAQGDPRDPWWAGAELRETREGRPVRVAMSIDPFGQGVDPLVEDAVKEAAKRLMDAGYEVEEVRLPRIAEAADLWRLLAMNDARRSMMKFGLDHAGPAFKNSFLGMLEHTPEVDIESYLDALERRTTILREWTLFMESYPVALLPVSMERPFARGLDQEGADAMGRIMRAQEPLFAFAVLGLPCLSVPTSTRDRIPLGVQLVAGRFREDLCLEAARVIESQR